MTLRRSIVAALTVAYAVALTAGVMAASHRSCVVCGGVLHETWLGSALMVLAIMPALVGCLWVLALLLVEAR